MEATERNNVDLLRKKKDTQLDKEIDRLHEKLREVDAYSDQYNVTIQHIERLVRLKETKKSRIDPNTVLIVAGNLIGILVIVAYEQRHVWSSRAVGFLLRPKNT